MEVSVHLTSSTGAHGEKGPPFQTLKVQKKGKEDRYAGNRQSATGMV